MLYLNFLIQHTKIIPFSEHAPPSKKPKLNLGLLSKYVCDEIMISKNKDQDVPLLTSFPLSKNYRSDVMAALETGMTLPAVASSIFKEDYVDVATCIPYSGKFSRTTNFADFVDFTSTSKINSSKFIKHKVNSFCALIDYKSSPVSCLLKC